MVDADNTYPAKYANDLLNGAKRYNCDMVIGDRLSGNYYEDNICSLWNRWSNI